MGKGVCKLDPNIMLHFILISLLIKVDLINSLEWNEVRCAADPQQSLSDGYLSDIGRFPWLGVIQHNLNIGGVQRYLITGAVLIHPAYAIATAADISKIPYESLANTTKLILWNSKEFQYAISIQDYVLHPEYENKLTLASIAMVQLLTYGETGVGDNNQRPVLPICLPIRGAGTFTDLYAVRMTDARAKLEKEAFKMSHVDENDCLTFYRKNKLWYNSTSPVSPTCAVTERKMAPCIWDAGAALITRQSWGYWKLLGFSVRGPGCGAPARFLNIFDYLPWINDIATPIPEEQENLYRIGVRRLSPVKLQIYHASTVLPKGIGYCDRKLRGNVLYKEAFEMTLSKNFAQGFFFLVINQIAEFTCAEVSIPVCIAKTNTAAWIEHYCNREISGYAPGQQIFQKYDYRKTQCFIYFKSSLFLEFRFFFSFKTEVEVTIYGTEERPRMIPDPFSTDFPTDRWWPTAKKLKWGSFFPYGLYKWYL